MLFTSSYTLFDDPKAPFFVLFLNRPGYVWGSTGAGRASGSLNISVISELKWLKFDTFFVMFEQTKFQLYIT